MNEFISFIRLLDEAKQEHHNEGIHFPQLVLDAAKQGKTRATAMNSFIKLPLFRQNKRELSIYSDVFNKI
jgi:hypothetical protein